MSLSVNPSRLSWDNAVNLRDVGGLPLRTGGSTRHLVLLRSGSLRLLTATDARVLLSVCGVAVVVDLRTAKELSADGPSVLAHAGVATVHLPLGREDRGASPEGDRPADPVGALRQAYRDYLDERGHHIATLARLVAGSTAATLVHSTAGKDRTGVAVGMLLDAVGVERSAVVGDYTATNDVIEQVVRTVATAHDGDGSRVADTTAHLARPAVLTELLEHVDDEYGGAAAWLRERGLTADELAGLRRRLVRPPVTG